jgi:hypothetical protein
MADDPKDVTEELLSDLVVAMTSIVQLHNGSSNAFLRGGATEAQQTLDFVVGVINRASVEITRQRDASRVLQDLVNERVPVSTRVLRLQGSRSPLMRDGVVLDNPHSPVLGSYRKDFAAAAALRRELQDEKERSIDLHLVIVESVEIEIARTPAAAWLADYEAKHGKPRKRTMARNRELNEGGFWNLLELAPAAELLSGNLTTMTEEELRREWETVEAQAQNNTALWQPGDPSDGENND